MFTLVHVGGGMNRRVSIIVPVYNSEQWLKKCIDSIVDQTYRDVEIILVDDESTDASPQICDSYALTDKRVQVLHKKNGGVSSARNLGLKYATGAWVVFVDSDDYLDKYIIKLSVEKAEIENDMLLCWNAKEVNEKVTPCTGLYIGKLTRCEAFATIIANYQGNYNLGKYVRAVWGKLFRNAILKKHNIQFNEKLYIGEDSIFLLKYLQCVDIVHVMDVHGYYYRILDNSAVRRYKADFFEQSIRQYESIIDILKDEYKNNYVVRDAIYVFQWEIFRSVIRNRKMECKRTIADYGKKHEDVTTWYKMMQSNVNRCRNIKWARKLVQMQNVIGTNCPMWFHYVLVIFYDWVVNKWKRK